ncbi:hypothetical protein SARC_03915 [Sphaeroforma arctica JP610]|uniref:Uncharacterized protein n=1 Tax=Sphaeroforma arctica JP610 TaxID=667725 RepID=A0A0L0G6J7_9EUKA|nr:hypothetical protein SARC_03915 [Sphaeroforma arctica JP610]KNC83858.1 hypothetical protein SARC_03915 [Sphaeroforma arctica JP610]|eukprot:XP_014157760.1 hypothetical protein SARC_03915 [Sphaeroforma arctica JP610]
MENTANYIVNSTTGKQSAADESTATHPLHKRGTKDQASADGSMSTTPNDLTENSIQPTTDRAIVGTLITAQQDINRECQLFREEAKQQQVDAAVIAKEKPHRLQMQLVTLSSHTKDLTQLDADAALHSMLPTLLDSVKKKEKASE